MSINLQDATSFMLDQGYILAVGKGKFKLSTKFHQEYAQLVKRHGPMTMLLSGTEKFAGVTEMRYSVPALPLISTTEKGYKQFIIDAQVPKRLEARRGESYPANTYSEAGMKAFRKAIEAGTDYAMLVRCVSLYYKSSINYKMAIGRFMEEGHWKTYYDELALAAGQGVEALNKLVTESTKDTDVDHYELG